MNKINEQTTLTALDLSPPINYKSPITIRGHENS